MAVPPVIVLTKPMAKAVDPDATLKLTQKIPLVVVEDKDEAISAEKTIIQA